MIILFTSVSIGAKGLHILVNAYLDLSFLFRNQFTATEDLYFHIEWHISLLDRANASVYGTPQPNRICRSF